MCNGNTYNKKFALCFAFIALIVFAVFSFLSPSPSYVCHAANEDEVYKEFEDNIDDILDDIDSEELDDFIVDDFDLDFFDGLSFKEIAISVLSGKNFDEYSSLFNGILGKLKENFLSVLSFFLSLFVIVILFEIFNNFCSDKYGEVKGVVKIVFSLLVALVVLLLLKNVVTEISETVQKLFNFSKILFPILLSLVLLSGAAGTHSVYSALSVFLLSTGSYVFVYVLMPLSVSIMVLSVVSCIFNNKRFSRVNDILKSIFKYTVIAFLSVYGLFAAVNAVSAGFKDGASYKLTKFAIKSYVPVLGGYLSDGFDFVHTCSVLIKNSFGICGIFVLLFIVIKPILLYMVYILMFKLLSVAVLFAGNEHFSDVFETISKSISYFITVLVGIFMCMFIFIYLLILSVSVV